MEGKEKRSSFTGSIGFVLAAAGSAVGLGNIWRFPYLAAKGGGGVFLLCYLVLLPVASLPSGQILQSWSAMPSAW